jgi:16S rRNA processing protein RimM
LSSERLRAGRVGRAHGLDGSFYVAHAVPSLLTVGALVMVGERELRIVRRAGTERRPIVRLEGCDDRTAAEALGGAELFVSRTAAPALDEYEWWAEDLEGCAVRSAHGRLGTVKRLLALPSCEVLEVERDDGEGELLVPLVADAVRDVDLAARVIEVDLRFLGAD